MKAVLVVDDSRVMRNIVKKTFEELNISVRFLEAPDGEKALQILLGNQVDLVLLDWNMPNMSGIGFLKQVRAMENYHKTPIIMVTSEASKINLVEAVKEGVTAYITKPFRPDDFMEKLSKISF
jgi:two-component system chemotaxis response regulator CheY